MNLVIHLFIGLVCTRQLPEAAAHAQKRDKVDEYYVRVEVKGDLVVHQDFKFDPKSKIGEPDPTGAMVTVGPLLFNWELVIRDKKHFDFVKANSGKKVIVFGKQVIIPQFSGPTRLGPQPTGSNRYVIEVSDIRQAGTNEQEKEAHPSRASGVLEKGGHG